MYASVHKAKKKDPRGSFFMLRITGLIVVVMIAAFTAWIALGPAVLIVRAAPRVLVRRMTWIAALRTIAYALIAFFMVIIMTMISMTAGCSAGCDCSVGHCYSGSCQGITIKR